jgi:site-specific recombinase XerD
METINPNASVCLSRSDCLLTQCELSDVVEEFLSWKKSYSKSAYKAYRIWVERFVRFTAKTPERLTIRDYIEFSDYVKSEFAPMSVQYALNIVHNLLRYFSEQGRLQFPMYLVRVPKARAESHYSITETEYEKLLAYISARDSGTKLRDQAMLMLLHDTGMRLGELLSLEVSDVQSEMSGTVRTEKTTQRRRVFWEQETHRTFMKYLDGRSSGGSTALFLGASRGKPVRCISPRGVQHMLTTACAGAGLTARICPHSFRHAFIHRMAKRGVPDAIIATLVGHSTPHTIAHYTKLSRPELESMYRFGPENLTYPHGRFAGIVLAG